jgi:glycosyltransferase involved in cell wall biosynthesis
MNRFQGRVALVHDWLVGMRGGEKLLEVLCELFPQATIFTLVHRAGSVAPSIERLPIRTSFIQHLPFGRSHYRYFLPLFPRAARGLDVRNFDLVISSSHAAAKGARIREGALHVCYCHSPMRYIWDQYEHYFGPGRASFAVRQGMKYFLSGLRRWDVETAQDVRQFVANSRTVQDRILKIYGRESTVIYPPVDVRGFALSSADDGYFLVVSALVPYKRIDVAIEAFNRLRKRLVIVGSGPLERALRSLAGATIEFTGWVDDSALKRYYAGCRALVFPGVEDFGIVPVEAMACGKPVIALAKGGALETVVEGNTGVFFQEQTPESIMDAVDRFEKMKFDGRAMRAHAEQFEKEICKNRLRALLDSVIGITASN